MTDFCRIKPATPTMSTLVILLRENRHREIHVDIASGKTASGSTSEGRTFQIANWRGHQLSVSRVTASGFWRACIHDRVLGCWQDLDAAKAAALGAANKTAPSARRLPRPKGVAKAVGGIIDLLISRRSCV